MTIGSAPIADYLSPEEDLAPGEDDLADFAPLGDLLNQGLDQVTALALCLETLDELMITGRPPAIADAAMTVEHALSAAEPVFLRLGQALDRLGMPCLQDAANRLRRSDQGAAATSAESLGTSLRRFARRSAAYHRRAQSLSRGLTGSLRTLHALGLAGSGRLLAEA